MAYLVRRFDENTAPQNFLRDAFDMQAGSNNWQLQKEMFANACSQIETVSSLPRKTQNRLVPDQVSHPCCEFMNEADTDWSLAQNRKWAENLFREWKERRIDSVPLSVGGKLIYPEGNFIRPAKTLPFPESLFINLPLPSLHMWKLPFRQRKKLFRNGVEKIL